MASIRQSPETKFAVLSPPDGAGDADHDIDPLNTAQVKRMAARPQKFRAPEFKYVYSDMDSDQAELEEWFAYADNTLLVESRDEFIKSSGASFRQMPEAKQQRYIISQISFIETISDREGALLRLFYIATGTFAESASDDDLLDLIRQNTNLLWKSHTIDAVYECIQHLFEEFYAIPLDDLQDLQSCKKGLLLALTVLYFMVQTRQEEDFGDELASLSPRIVPYFLTQISSFRLHIPDDLPWRNILLLTWKLILRIFGNSQDLLKAKAYAREKVGLPLETKKDTITATPLDYQAFRQGIRSRYPGYRPPNDVLPKEFPYTTNSAASSSSTLAEFAVDPLPGSSVHIATPAPSPPPSPPPTAKSKKSSFQTDQSFPFLYPQDVDIPVSIREAEEIFAQRTRTSLWIVQLWAEREEFMKQERGWIDAGDPLCNDGDDEHVDPKNSSSKRLARVESAYKDTLQDLQAVVVTLLKMVLSTVSPESAGTFARRQQFLNGESEIHTYPEVTIKSELEDARETELTLKAITGILYLLLKWFKTSHILKSEFLAQLLYDSNALPLILQLFNTKEIEQFVLQIPEVPKLKFFPVCRALAKGEELPDRERATTRLEESGNEKTVDEILQQDEISVFSHRNFFISINILKIMQKICKNKAHRNLMIVQLKASNSLRKMLRISQYEARLYALKIIKGQVPYCGRKWRHMNMRVITAIYLYCRQDLRDSWLAGVDIDADIEDSYPREVALRALIQFYNTRRYPEAAVALGYQNTEDDFFAKELETLMIDEQNQAEGI
ncbi:hypothetical protein V1509DRAFT_632075 [Lipomyces kononenkoae]